MPRLRDTDDIDVEALEAIEYSTEEYTSYVGEVPPIGLELIGYVKRLWWTRTAPKANGGGDDPMLKVLWVASDNDGDLAEFNECPFWLNAPLVPGAKFRWDPFLLAYGLTLTQVKTKTYVAQKEDQNGLPIERIATWHPGADRDEAWCRIITGQEPYNGVPQARVAEWIAWDAEEAPEDGDDGEEDLADEADDEADDEDYEDEEGEDEDGEDEPEPDDEPEPPARSRGARTRSGGTTRTRSAQPARTASRPATAKTGSRARSTSAKAAPATTARSTARSGRAAPARSGGKPATGRRGSSKPANNDPPF